MGSSSLDGFCGERFWDYELTWNTSNPDVTQCFQKTVLVWIPCCFLWFFAPLETFHLLKSNSKDIPWTALNISKVIITAVLSLLCLSNLGHTVFNSVSRGDVPSVDFYEPFIKFISFALVICFIICGRMRGIQSSGVLFLFWLILMLCEAVTYRSYIMHAVDNVSVAESFPFVVFMLYYPLVVVEFILSCFSDGRPQYREYAVEDEKGSPENSASFLSKMLFWWFNGLVVTGWKRPLTTGDLWSLNYQDQSEKVVPIFDRYWNAELLKVKMAVKSASYSPRRSTDDVKFTGLEPQSKPTIVRALVKAFGLVFLQGAVFKLFHDVLQFVSPQILKLLIGFISSNDPLWKGVFYAVVMFLCATLQSVMLSFYFHRMYLVAMRIRTSLISAIYRKALVLSNSAKRKSTLGEIVNLMSVDAQKFMDLMPFLNLLWSAPLQIALALYFLWGVLGPSVLAGLVVMVLVIPLNGVIANLSKKLQVEQMKNKDERVKLMNEILGGIKVLKLYAWEESFQNQVLTIREKELQKLRKMAYLSAVMSFVWTCAPYLVSLTSFATYVLSSEDHVLNAERAFVALTLFQLLRFPLSMLPMLITMLVQAAVSIKRINKFLTNEELDQYVEYDQTDPDSLTIEHGTFAWQKDESITLKNISIAVPKGSLLAVVGQVGSGKSSVLSALLGDMEKIEGRVNRKGSIAYVAQQAWVQNATLRDNILFYHVYNKEKYEKVVDACALKPDFSILPGQDLTEIGEKGINLSGGQKQRISLARAVYSDGDIYLLDDPLSAVDSHVGKHIFENVIGPKGLLKKKTRVLVTHGITYLPQTDKIIVMKDGSILEEGSYQELLDKKGAFADFLLQHLKENIEESVDELEDQEIAVVEEIINKVGSPDLNRQMSLGGSEADLPNRNRETIIRSLSRQLSMLSYESSGSDHGVHQRRSISKTKLDGSPVREESISAEKIMDGKVKGKDDAKQNGAEFANNANLIQSETAETGEVKSVVYLQYFKSLGVLWAALLAIGYTSLQGFSVGANFWLSMWSNDEPKPDGSQDVHLRNVRLGVYGMFGLLQGLAVMMGATALAYGTIRASRLLHFKLLKQIFRSPMSFFETTPLGRIVNRFSKDVDTVDVTIPMTVRSWIICALHVVATAIVISVETPSFLIVIIPIGILYYFIQKVYVASSRQLKRLESITRSPIYSHFSETLAGVTTVRGYDAQRLFIKESDKLVDLNHVCYYPSVVANRWLAVRLEFCGNCIILFAALFAALGRETLNPGSVGLSVSYALSVTATLNWLVRMASELETNIVAVERIEEYATAPTEAPWESESSARPPDTWPSEGKINFEKYSTRYREGLDLVLKGITCDIQPGEKVGIVGRTGAGKSSLTLSLFRIIEGSGGNILIDGIDISKIGLHDLRSSITIIPQDPVLFSGTLRMNLDPFSCYNDNEVWIALEHSHLKAFVSSLKGGLLYEVSEGGENLSVGQRQLVCLARALLRKTKVLVLDEATAAVDLETDALIQSTIRTEFADCTILTIAHRLNTIMDYDKVMVLDKGVIKEFDSPEVLLEKKQSLFYSMAKDAGLA